MHSPFTVAEARQAGLKRWHLEGSSWKRLTHGTYVWAGESDITMTTLIAVAKRFPRSAAFSGMTAAWLHGVGVRPLEPVEITVPAHVGVSRPTGMRVRRALLPGYDVVRVRGLRATSIVRTIADISSRATLTEAVAIADAALHSGRTRREKLNAWAAAHGRRPGIRRLRRVIEFSDPGAESPMESRLRMLLVLGGLPRPRAQVPIHDSDGRFVGRPDLYFEEARLGIEYDGGTHRDSLVEDNHRQNSLLGAGVTLLRFTHADIVDPAFVVAQIRSLLLSRRSATSTWPA